MNTEIWPKVTKNLNFAEIEKRMKYRGIRFEYDFQDDYRSILFPVDKDDLFGKIRLVELYSDTENQYLFYIEYGQDSSADNFIYRLDSFTGRTIEEGQGLSDFEKKLKKDWFLSRLGVPKEEYGLVRENLIVSIKKLLSVIDFEVKQSIRSNAEDFILNLEV